MLFWKALRRDTPIANTHTKRPGENGTVTLPIPNGYTGRLADPG